MANDKFWSVVKRFNALMNSAIDGPNCLDMCHGDCCSIRINVPKILANEFINLGYANKEDFIRSDVFSFKLRFDEKKGKCFLFDKNINGCSVHNSGIKPPQCWIYPTNFSNPESKEIKCKRADGWRITDFEKTKEADKLLQYYVFLCQLEAREELKDITKRLDISLSKKDLLFDLKSKSPKEIAGFKDNWDIITTLPAEGISLQMKKYCINCGKKREFLECNSICEEVSLQLTSFLQQNLPLFVRKNPDSSGEYPFYKLCKFSENKV